MLYREKREFHTARHPGLVENIGDVMFDRVLTDGQLPCDSPIRFARGYECQHVTFASCQMKGSWQTNWRFQRPVVVAARQRLDNMGEVLPSHPHIAVEYGPDTGEQLLNGRVFQNDAARSQFQHVHDVRSPDASGQENRAYGALLAQPL